MYLKNSCNLYLKGKKASNTSYADLMLTRAPEPSKQSESQMTYALQRSELMSEFDDTKSIHTDAINPMVITIYNCKDITVYLKINLYFLKNEVDTDYDEIREKGAIKTNVYWLYFSVALGCLGPILVILLFISTQALTTGLDYWLGYWYVSLKENK